MCVFLLLQSQALCQFQNIRGRPWHLTKGRHGILSCCPRSWVCLEIGLPQITLVKHALPSKWQLKGVYSPFSDTQDTQDTHVKLCSSSPPSMASITGNWTSRRPGRLPNLTKFGTAARQMIVLLSFVVFSVSFHFSKALQSY